MEGIDTAIAAQQLSTAGAIPAKIIVFESFVITSICQSVFNNNIVNITREGDLRKGRCQAPVALSIAAIRTARPSHAIKLGFSLRAVVRIWRR